MVTWKGKNLSGSQWLQPILNTVIINNRATLEHTLPRRCRHSSVSGWPSRQSGMYQKHMFVHWNSGNTRRKSCLRLICSRKYLESNKNITVKIFQWQIKANYLSDLPYYVEKKRCAVLSLYRHKLHMQVFCHLWSHFWLTWDSHPFQTPVAYFDNKVFSTLNFLLLWEWLNLVFQIAMIFVNLEFHCFRIFNYFIYYYWEWTFNKCYWTFSYILNSH